MPWKLSHRAAVKKVTLKSASAKLSNKCCHCNWTYLHKINFSLWFVFSAELWAIFSFITQEWSPRTGPNLKEQAGFPGMEHHLSDNWHKNFISQVIFFKKYQIWQQQSQLFFSSETNFIPLVVWLLHLNQCRHILPLASVWLSHHPTQHRRGNQRGKQKRE